jgi:hypothetical protein
MGQQLPRRAILRKPGIGSSALVYIMSTVGIIVNYEAEKMWDNACVQYKVLSQYFTKRLKMADS